MPSGLSHVFYDFIRLSLSYDTKATLISRVWIVNAKIVCHIINTMLVIMLLLTFTKSVIHYCLISLIHDA